MDKLTDMLTDELDSQPTPPTPDPPDVGENKKHSQIATPDDTQPTPPSKETLNRIPQHLRDNVLRSQDSDEVQLETFTNHNTTPADSFPGSNKKTDCQGLRKRLFRIQGAPLLLRLLNLHHPVQLSLKECRLMLMTVFS